MWSHNTNFSSRDRRDKPPVVGRREKKFSKDREKKKMTPHLSLAVVLGFSAAFNKDYYYKAVESIAPREPPIILEEEPWTMMQHIAEPAPLPLPSPSPSPRLVKTDSRFQTLVKTDSFFDIFQKTIPTPIIPDLYWWFAF